MRPKPDPAARAGQPGVTDDRPTGGGVAGFVRRQGRFSRRLAVLSGGTVLGQAVLVLSSPLLTRLYTPEEFGTLAVFSSFSSIFAVAMAWRYEHAVPICEDDLDAAAVAVAAAAAATLSSTFLAVLVALAGADLAARLGMPQLAVLFWLLPLFLLFFGWSHPLAYWAIRRGRFRGNAAGVFGQFTGQAGAQLGLGVLGAGGTGLVVGYGLGYLVRFAILLGGLRRADLALLARVEARRVGRVARAQWRFPAFAAPSALLQSVSQMLPAVLVAVLYGPAMAGLFGLGQRVMGAPVRMLSEATSQVFLAEIALVRGPALRRLFLRVTGRFLLLGLAGSLPLLLAGPALFALVFGEVWREAGAIVQVLVPVYLARFVVLPVSHTLSVANRQHLHLVASLLNVLALAVGFGLGAWLTLPPLATILLYSLGSTAAFAFYLLATWRAAQAAGAEPATPSPAAAYDPDSDVVEPPP